ncbi:MAG TPA: amidohydrolase family protein [Novosphingobium sp.]|nr:amidohydrolase family protein [Novosphingobium sp.]
MTKAEAAIDPARPIIDPHLHFWHIRSGPNPEPQRFLFDEALAAIAQSGHAVTHSVFVECGQMYRADGPAELRSLGETEFVNGIAAMGASGGYGPARLAHRIVGNADLALGAGVRPVLEAHRAVAGERFRGVRMETAWSEEGLFGFPCDPAGRGVMTRPGFVAGARELAALGLSLDVWCLHTQLGELAALADAVPDLTIVLDHLGTPECSGAWAARPEEAFAQWSGAIRELALRPNVRVKIGGMGMNVAGTLTADDGPGTGESLAGQWQARVETAIAAFTPERAMFESNFPPDRCAASYVATWNAFKRLAADYSEDEKDRLFRGTAAEVYRI